MLIQRRLMGSVSNLGCYENHIPLSSLRNFYDLLIYLSQRLTKRTKLAQGRKEEFGSYMDHDDSMQPFQWMWFLHYCEAFFSKINRGFAKQMLEPPSLWARNQRNSSRPALIHQGVRCRQRRPPKALSAVTNLNVWRAHTEMRWLKQGVAVVAKLLPVGFLRRQA